MEENNKKAVLEIILPQKLDNSDQIDLHGLLVAEAIEETKKYIKHCLKIRKEKVEVVTGAGNHSDPHKGAVIKPAIVNLCKQEVLLFIVDFWFILLLSDYNNNYNNYGINNILKGWRFEKHEKNEGSLTVHLHEKKLEQ